MSRRVVLDADNVSHALADTNKGIIGIILEICDHIAVNDLVLEEYSRSGKVNVKDLLAVLEMLNENTPTPKFISPNMGPMPNIPRPPSHRRLIVGAVRASANLLVMNTEMRGRWGDLARDLREQYQLRVLSPDNYLSERGSEA